MCTSVGCLCLPFSTRRSTMLAVSLGLNVMSAHEGQTSSLSSIAALCLFWSLFWYCGLSSRPGDTIFFCFLIGGQIVSYLLWSLKFKLLNHGPMHIKSPGWASAQGQSYLAKHRLSPWDFFLLCKMMTISLIWGLAVVCVIWVIFGIRRRYGKDFSLIFFLAYF